MINANLAVIATIRQGWKYLFAVAVLAFASAGFGAGVPGSQYRRPNIVFLMADDHRASAMGAMGDRYIHTPNLDTLAAKGIMFRRCYATSPLCMASRATVFTGMYEYKTGCNFLTGRLSAKDWNKLSYRMG